MQEVVLDLVQRVFPRIVTFKRRSSQWEKVRKAYLAIHPKCECCGGSKSVQVHHKKPFYLFPELELVPENFISLCDNHCHLLVGHLGSWKSFNVTAFEDANYIFNKVLHRPRIKNQGEAI